MSIDRNHIKTQDELDEPAPMDVVEARVEAEMKKLEGKAKKDVADGLENEQQASEGKKLEQESERELKETEKENG